MDIDYVMSPRLIYFLRRPASQLANLLCPTYLRCALRTRSYMRGVMASHNVFVSPSRRASRDAFVIESSSPDLPPLQDLLSQTSTTSTHATRATRKKSSEIAAARNSPSAGKREKPQTSTSKYWKRTTSSTEGPVLIHDTPPGEDAGSSRLQYQDDLSNFSPPDVSGQEHRSPSQPWKVFKKTPPRMSTKGSAMAKAPKFVAKISDSVDCVMILDEDSKVAREGQSHKTPEPQHQIKGIKEDASLPLNLEPAVARRLDWTPPVPKNAVYDDLASAFETGISSSRDEEEGRELKAILAGCGYEAPEHNYRPVPQVENSGLLNKRKLIELVPATSANSTTSGLQEESPTKPKAPKKKARTITELATAAYQVPTNDVAEVSSTSAVEETGIKSTEATGSAVGMTNGKTKAKSRKKAAKPSKKNEPKKSVLLSPNTALKAAENQNFVFGTSSQLAREQSPTLLREIQAAIKSSAQFDDSNIQEIPINSDSLEPPVQKPKLWEAAARDLDGDLFNVEIIDLVGNSPSTLQKAVAKDPFGYIGAENEPSLPPLSGITTDHVDDSFETLSDILPPTNPKILTPADGSNPFSGSQEVIDTSGQKTKAVAEIQLGKASNRAQPSEARTESDIQGTPETAPPCPSYQLFSDAQLAKEFASYGFKPVKKRTAMISLLEQCWRSKVGGVGSGARALTTSATALQSRGNSGQVTETPPSPKRPRGRPRKSPTPTIEHEQEPPPSAQPTSSPPKPRKAPRKPKSNVTSLNSKQPTDPIPTQASPKRGRGRPRKSPSASSETSSAAAKPKVAKPKPSIPRTVVEIPDSESDNDDNSSIMSSSSLGSTSSPPPSMNLSASINEDTELSLLLSTGDDEASLFEHISKAVVTAPRSTDPTNPSWHEKILIYDPIVLEDLTAWLNLGQLTRVGHDGEVSPGEVKKWCESKSICCLWRVNLRGKERKRY